MAALSTDDLRRLRGDYIAESGRRLAPHVATPSGLFFLNRIELPPGGLPCPSCGAAKVRPLPAAQGDGRWCSGCGRRWL